MPMHEPHLFQHDTAEGERGGVRGRSVSCVTKSLRATCVVRQPTWQRIQMQERMIKLSDLWLHCMPRYSLSLQFNENLNGMQHPGLPQLKASFQSSCLLIYACNLYVNEAGSSGTFLKEGRTIWGERMLLLSFDILFFN